MSIASSMSGFSGDTDIEDTESNEVCLSSHSEKVENDHSPCSNSDRYHQSVREKKPNSTFWKSRSVKFSIVALMVVIAAFVIILAFLFTTLLLLNDGVSQMRFESYDHFYWNRETNHSAFGRVVMPANLGPSTFTTYTTKNGGEGIISKFGTEIYECRGSCYCADDTERRNAGIGVLKRSVFYVLAAVSSAIAIDSAKSHFENQCIDELENSCPSMDVKSEVDSCINVRGSEHYKELYGSLNRKKGKDRALKKFSCSGRCAGQTEKAENCGDFGVADKVIGAYAPPYTKEDVEFWFRGQILHPFCQEYNCSGYSTKKVISCEEIME